jgi:hypothetical protein
MVSQMPVEALYQNLLGQMESSLAYLAMYWRGSDDDAEAAEIARCYQSILLCMLDLGLDHCLMVESELPDELMPPAYFARFT